MRRFVVFSAIAGSAAILSGADPVIVILAAAVIAMAAYSREVA